MATRTFLIAYALLLVLTTCKGKPVVLESDYFRLLSTTQISTTDENEVILEKAEDFYTQILNILGDERRPNGKITLRLEGDFVEQGPYFDSLGIHLYRYSPSENGYLSLLAHEMVHAFREDYYNAKNPYEWEYYPYLDEGFAEYVAQLVDTTKTGFPWYGHNEYAVIGDMALSDNLIPHQKMREQHHELNQPCHIQTYTQRSSWTRYIDETYGRTTLLNLIFTEEDPSYEFQSALFGEDLATIDTNWEKWVLDNYNKTPNTKELAQAFRERTSWYNYCDH